MNKIAYKLTLISDAEPGSGLGNEAVNAIAARDHYGRPVLRGSHLKGLLREQFVFLFPGRPDLETILFGDEGENSEGGARVPDAHIASGGKLRNITRTEVGSLGTVE